MSDARVLGVDLGERRIGLARSDRAGRLALPWKVLERTGDVGQDLEALRSAAVESGARTVVVGLPLSLSGGRGPAARRALATARRLQEALRPHAVVVETMDERLTTVSANNALVAAGLAGRARRQRVDSAAAAVLLQAWLERARHAGRHARIASRGDAR